MHIFLSREKAKLRDSSDYDQALRGCLQIQKLSANTFCIAMSR